jgi:predicted nucleic acid-binding protein
VTFVPVRHRVILCRDPKSDAYLSLAKSVPSDLLVTEDLDLLSLEREKLDLAGLAHLRIVDPKDFLAK